MEVFAPALTVNRLTSVATNEIYTCNNILTVGCLECDPHYRMSQPLREKWLRIKTWLLNMKTSNLKKNLMKEIKVRNRYYYHLIRDQSKELKIKSKLVRKYGCQTSNDLWPWGITIEEYYRRESWM